MADEQEVARQLSSEQGHTLRHALGCADKKRAPATFYRSHFVTDEASVDHPHCMALLDMGLMTRRAAVKMFGGMDCFNVTGRGEAVCRALFRLQNQRDEVQS